MQAQAVQQTDTVDRLWVLQSLKSVLRITQVTLVINGHNGSRPQFVTIDNPTLVETARGWYLKNGTASYPPTTPIVGLVLQDTLPQHSCAIFEECWKRRPDGKFVRHYRHQITHDRILRRHWR